MEKYFLLLNILLLVKSLAGYGASWTSCKSHRDCENSKYSYCTGVKCQCMPNYPLSDFGFGGCKGVINEECDSDFDCYHLREGVGCILNTCQNYTDFFKLKNNKNLKLYRASRIGSECKTDEHCSDLLNAACISGKCKCPTGYWRVYDKEVCRPVTNATCTYSTECKEEGTRCLLGTCVLPNEFFVESNPNASLYVAKRLYEYCENDDHCRNLDNTECNFWHCQCNSNSIVKEKYTSDDSKIKIKECRQVMNVSCNNKYRCDDSNSDIKCFLGTCFLAKDFFVPSNAHNVSLYAAFSAYGSCQTDHHCRNVNNSYCYDGECRCSEGYGNHDLSHYGECRRYSDTVCTNDFDCIQKFIGFPCISNACQDPQYYFKSVDIHKYRAKSIEDYCQFDDNCRDLNNSRCFRNKCICTYGYEYESGECQKKPPAYCFKDRHCSVEGEYCFNGRCQTDMEFVGSSIENSNLYAAKDFFRYCQTDHHCRNINNTRCYFGSCFCVEGSVKISGVCRNTFNVSCSKDSDCFQYGTKCFVNICLSTKDFFNPANAYKVDLYTAKRIYDDCRSDYHCRYVNNTYCRDQLCGCLSGYENVDGTCQKAINVSCVKDSDCLLPGTYCFFGYCLYTKDFLSPSSGYDTSLYAAKRINGFCQNHHHCREIKNSMCFHRKCICKDQYFSYGNDCLFQYYPHIPTVVQH